jgi:hypothetical protein
MSQVQGQVEAISNKFGKFSVLVDGNWYASKQEYTTNWDHTPMKGEIIQFDSGKTGKYLNYPKLVGSSPAPEMAPPKANPAPANNASRQFPVAPLAPERTINRQNALTNAVNATVRLGFETPSMKHECMETLGDEIITLARKFEAYTTGDLDMEEVKASMNELTSTEEV